MTGKPDTRGALFGVLSAVFNQTPIEDGSISEGDDSRRTAHSTVLREIAKLQCKPSCESVERLLEILAQPWLPQAAQLQVLLALQALAPESVPFIERSFFSTREKNLRILTLKAAARILAAKISGGYVGMSRESLHVRETSIRWHLEDKEFATTPGYQLSLDLFAHLRKAVSGGVGDPTQDA